LSCSISLIGGRAEAAVFLLTAIMVALGALSASEFKAFNFLWTNPSQR